MKKSFLNKFNHKVFHHGSGKFKISALHRIDYANLVLNKST